MGYFKWCLKDVSQLLLVIAIGLGLGFLVGDYINLKFAEPEIVRDFEFRGGMTMQGGNYKRSISEVVINNNDDYTDDEMLNMVYDYYILMNGEPDEVTFNFYYSTGALHRSDPYLTHTFHKATKE